ncbi:MAG: S41 family peptidase [Cytophagales bacterium]|nr:S41 family peptidase [Cytophagales bacterium]
MKNSIKPLIGIIFIALLAGSCRNSDVITPASITPSTTGTTTPKSSVNSWIYSVMNEAYFWAANLPTKSSLDTTISSFDFFEKLIYERKTVDRFSTLTDNFADLQNSFNGVQKVYGIRYTIAETVAGSGNLGLFLSDVLIGSPAEQAGLKRGDVIIAIDGNKITADNFSSLFQSSETHNFQLGTFQNSNWATTKTLSITRAVVNENPVAFSSVLTLPVSGKKMGYLLYNQFIPGTDVNANIYDNQIRTVFTEFKAAGVEELVLDLRFNGGGYISSAEVLASLITSKATTSNVFYKEKWNANYERYYSNKYGANYFNHNFLSEPANIGSKLTRVFVLTSHSTASASELIINGLKPYINVITIGESTYGKNLFGTLVEDTKTPSSYGIYVMLGETTNALGASDYGTINGITPTYEVKDDIVPYAPMGDFNETLLKKALEVMGETSNVAARIISGTKINRYSPYTFKETEELPMGKMITDFKPRL